MTQKTATPATPATETDVLTAIPEGGLPHKALANAVAGGRTENGLFRDRAHRNAFRSAVRMIQDMLDDGRLVRDRLTGRIKAA